MKAAQIRSERQFEVHNWKQLGIQSYGCDNAFPQTVDEILKASKTGNACRSIYCDFVRGQGFDDERLNSISVGLHGQKLIDVLRACVDDFTKWHGFAIHVNYNANFRVSSIAHMPFESLRLGLPDGNGYTPVVRFHPDWGHRDHDRLFKASDIETFSLFEPDPEYIQRGVEKAGGWDKYKGQILYYSADGGGMNRTVYPVPLFVAELTDMRTEEGLANVTGRNVCSNFLAAGMVVDIKAEEQDEIQVRERQLELEQFQGDENASQLWYVQVKDKEQVPEFVKFTGENYDKSFTATQSQIPENIGQAFKQPPILRAVDVGANFGADLMTNAYRYYNSVTSDERARVSEVFKHIFMYWKTEIPDDVSFNIRPLSYSAGLSVADRLGTETTTQMLQVLQGEESVENKRNILRVVFGLSPLEIDNLLPYDIEA